MNGKNGPTHCFPVAPIHHVEGKEERGRRRGRCYHAKPKRVRNFEIQNRKKLKIDSKQA